MASKLKKSRGIEELKSRWGFMFILPWLVGLVMFFFIPIGQSLIFSFSSINAIGENLGWKGLEHYDYLLNKDPNYSTWLTDSLTELAYSMPIILVLSLILAMMLNQKFRGRLFFRALYF